MAEPEVHAGGSEEYLSYWLKSSRPPARPALMQDAECDVAVLGGGIVGVTVAHLLARAGVDVVLLEARRIGAGTTGYTTAKITSLHGFTYAKLESSLGEGTARVYA